MAFKNNGDNKTSSHFMLPDITRTNLPIWEDIRDAVLIPLNGLPTFKGRVPRSLVVVYINLFGVHV